MTHAAAKHPNPENMSRQQKLAAIRAEYRRDGMKAATQFWLANCPRISKAAFQEACQ